MRVVLTTAAEADLASVFDWLAEQNEDFADAYVRKLQEAALTFGDFPKLGALRPEWGHEVRVRFVDRYCFAYRNRRERVEILRIVHTSRDLHSLFQNHKI